MQQRTTAIQSTLRVSHSDPGSACEGRGLTKQIIKQACAGVLYRLMRRCEGDIGISTMEG